MEGAGEEPLTELIFDDGTKIKVNRSLLSSRSEFFREKFHTEGPIEVKLEKIDSASFEEFLECMESPGRIVPENLMRIVQIVDKFKVRDLKAACLELLHSEDYEIRWHCVEPDVLSCSEEFLPHIIEKMRQDNNQEVLDYPQFAQKITPAMLLQMTERSTPSQTFNWKILTWAHRHREIHHPDEGMREFLSKRGLTKLISLKVYDIPSEFIRFYQSEMAEGVLTQTEILERLEELALWAEDQPPKEMRTQWTNVAKGQTIVETVETYKSQLFTIGVDIYVWLNFCRAYDVGDIKCDICVHYKTLSDHQPKTYESSRTFICGKELCRPRFRFSNFHFGGQITISDVVVTYRFNISGRFLKTSGEGLYKNQVNEDFYMRSVTITDAEIPPRKS